MFGSGFDPTLPDYSSQISAALAANAAKGATPKKGGFGGFLRNFAGYLGDNLSGNNVYASTVAQQRQMEQQAAEQQQQIALAAQQAEARRQAELQDYVAKKQIDQQYQGPPGLANEFNWFENLPPEQKAQAQQYMSMRYPGMNAPVTVPYGATVQGGGGQSPQPGTVDGGYRFKGGNPADPNAWEKLGGSTGAPSSNFP